MGVKISFPNLLIGLYQRYEQLLNPLQNVLLLFIRVAWGFFFMQAGWGKWHDIAKVTGFFTDLGIPWPAPNAYVVATTELVGGAFLLLGLLSRLAPIPLIIAMSVAYITTEQDALRSLATGDFDPFLSATPFLFLFASLIILIFGPGIVSVDHLLLKIPGIKKAIAVQLPRKA